MKIDAVSLGAYTGVTQSQTVLTEETGSSPDDFDDTRVASVPAPPAPASVSNPIEKNKGSVEDLMDIQVSTERMAHSYGFSSIDQAANMSSGSSSTQSSTGFALSA